MPPTRRNGIECPNCEAYIESLYYRASMNGRQYGTIDLNGNSVGECYSEADDESIDEVYDYIYVCPECDHEFYENEVDELLETTRGVQATIVNSISQVYVPRNQPANGPRVLRHGTGQAVFGQNETEPANRKVVEIECPECHKTNVFAGQPQSMYVNRNYHNYQLNGDLACAHCGADLSELSVNS